MRPGLLQFLEMMRDGGGGDALLHVELAAEKAIPRGDLLENGEPARFGQRAGDRLDLLRRQMDRVRTGSGGESAEV